MLPRRLSARPPERRAYVQLIHEGRKNEKLVNSPQSDDRNKLRDGVFVRGPDEMIALTSVESKS
jgi:hypothetical protein